MPDLNATLEKLKKLDAERQSLVETTKKGLLEAVEANLASLANLGFEYDLVERSAWGGRGKRERKPGERLCSVCGTSGHNSRTCPQKKR